MTTLYISPNGSYVSSEDSEQDRNAFFAQHDDVHKEGLPEDWEQDIDEWVDEFISNLHRNDSQDTTTFTLTNEDRTMISLSSNNINNINNIINNTEENAMNNNIETLKAQAKATIEAKLKAAREKAELELLMNEKFQDAMVNQQIREETSARLSDLNAQCEAIVAGMEVYSKTLRKVRTWNPSKRYGYGNQFAELSGLLSGIQYSVQEHSEQMLAVTGLSKDLIERTLNALGNTPYYTPTYDTIVEGNPTNVEELLQCLQLIEHQLGIIIDKSLITQTVADRLYHVAKVRAEAAQAEAQLAINMEFAITR